MANPLHSYGRTSTEFSGSSVAAACAERCAYTIRTIDADTANLAVNYRLIVGAFDSLLIRRRTPARQNRPLPVPIPNQTLTWYSGRVVGEAADAVTR